MSTVVTVDPATGKPLTEYPALSDADVDAALDRAAQVQVGWAARSSEDRPAVLRRAAAVLRAEADVAPGQPAYDEEVFGPVAAGIREFVDVRTWWVLDEPAVTAPASE
jgi:acyl-CoA reductase-like NAD-dependent aldehyde dehydrogenase